MSPTLLESPAETANASPGTPWEVVAVQPETVMEALHHVRSLEGLSEDEFQWLVDNGESRVVADSRLIFRSGDPAHEMSILLEGEIQVRRLNSGPTAVFVGRSHELTGKLPFSRMKTYGGEGHAVGRVWLLSYPESLFPEMLVRIPSMAQRCVSILLDRVREVTRIEQQAEKLSALGKLAANLSHELNNPASAARSAANSLWTELRNYGYTKYQLGSMCFTSEDKARYSAWTDSVKDLVNETGRPLRSDAMELSGREDALTRWMEEHGVEEPWKTAPTLAETRIELSHLDGLLEAVGPKAMPVALASFAAALKAERMTDAVIDSTRRIFELITAIKDYSYMDQAPIQEVDVPQALENTLAMLNSRLNAVRVTREYDPDTPCILAYGSELNQVWMALIENALDSMDLCERDDHELRLVTRASGPNLLVEVWDNGPGIDPDIASRIFEPFFTTKPVGVALGLGLDAANRIVTKHRGSITMQSKPGSTCFQVRVPIEQAGAY